MNLLITITMITDLPLDVLDQFVVHPECQLRATCHRFHRELRRVPFRTIREFRQSRLLGRVAHWNRSSIKNTVTGKTEVKGGAPYILLYDDLGAYSGYAIFDSNIIQFLTQIDQYTLYRAVFRITKLHAQRPVNLVSFDSNIKTDMVAVFDDRSFNGNFYYSIINYVDEFTVPFLKYESQPAWVYTSVNARV